jgi:hypothetical protein
MPFWEMMFARRSGMTVTDVDEIGQAPVADRAGTMRPKQTPPKERCRAGCAS